VNSPRRLLRTRQAPSIRRGAAFLERHAHGLRIGQTVGSVRNLIPQFKLDCGTYTAKWTGSPDFTKIILTFDGSGCVPPSDDAEMVDVVFVAAPKSKVIDGVRGTLTQRLGPPARGCREYSTGNEQILSWQDLHTSIELSGGAGGTLDSVAVYRGQPSSRDAGRFTDKPCSEAVRRTR